MSGTDDPIVIAGMAVEAPGGIDTLTGYWAALEQGRELLEPLPRDRDWPIREMLSVHEHDGWGTIPDAGGFLTGATVFDPQFFGMSPREAVAADPQQRVALRVAWRALEQAGINPARLDGAEVGCFLGVSAMEYGPLVAEVNEHSGFRVVGKMQAAVAGRISHALGLTGPALTVDAACASSLAALHQAAAAVRAGECEWALAGAVCVMGSPAAFYEFAKNKAQAADGHCRPYAEGAAGTVWGEGAGVVVVERESRSRAMGHRVYGRILATRVNHNGGGAPLAVPSAAAQERLIRATLDAAGLDPALVGMIEGHGTATAVGDPIELAALAATYGAAHQSSDPVLLGSVKSNLGHAQAASGLLGLIKLLLCGAHGTVAPTLHAGEPTTAVDWAHSGLRLATTPQPWHPVDGIRYGAVSSFGVTGTNAHAVLALPALEDTHA
ncbi:beta-ketoacyl [acyl carrier protein] synthase domain-containing protein [Nocardia stercoris]|uniref:Polyketide synthase n=1 Tax=Nocardia stercoris TaxID=2483361 RepID=A0A3M2KVY2_9NOCA|nr:polyketide synthase [Nocardia stercoris]RMI28373.1 polyketide synthase [Nocardia stercoris]